MEIRQRCRKPCRHRDMSNVNRMPQRVRGAKRAGTATTEQNHWTQGHV